jgi:hypothetical protein
MAYARTGSTSVGRRRTRRSQLDFALNCRHRHHWQAGPHRTARHRQNPPCLARPRVDRERRDALISGAMAGREDEDTAGRRSSRALLERHAVKSGIPTPRSDLAVLIVLGVALLAAAVAGPDECQVGTPWFSEVRRGFGPTVTRVGELAEPIRSCNTPSGRWPSCTACCIGDVQSLEYPKSQGCGHAGGCRRRRFRLPFSPSLPARLR